MIFVGVSNFLAEKTKIKAAKLPPRSHGSVFLFQSCSKYKHHLLRRPIPDWNDYSRLSFHDHSFIFIFMFAFYWLTED